MSERTLNKMERLAELSGVFYTKPTPIIKKTIPKVNLLETEKYKSEIKEITLDLIKNSDKDSQIALSSKSKSIQINDNKYLSGGINGIITFIINNKEILETNFSIEEIAYEIKSNKSYYLDNLDIKKLTRGKNFEITDCFVSLKGNDIVIKLYYQSEKKIKKKDSSYIMDL